LAQTLRYNGLYQGAVAGRVVDKKGRLVQGYPVVIRPISVDAENPRTRYLTTYRPTTTTWAARHACKRISPPPICR